MTRHRTIGVLGALAVGLAACQPGARETSAEVGAADRLRSVTTFRQWHGESRLATGIIIWHGSLRVVPGPRNELFRLTSSYSDEKSVPDGVYNAEKGLLSIGGRAENTDAGGASTGPSISITIGDDQSSDDLHSTASTPVAAALDATSTLALSPAVATALDISLIGTKGDVELGGLQTSSLEVNALAGETSVRFSQPNATACTSLDVTAGLSELSLIGLGNSRCQTLDITGAAGHVTLDFAGSWPTSVTMHAKVVAGSLTIRVPRNVGVHLTSHSKLLAHLSMPDMSRTGDTLVSPNYGSAARRLDIETTAVIGEISLERID